ncbi:S8 family serine peptidase [Chitinophaga nivalis]|uniref:S8 family serine peptidase n=1 Tax=Chitinophaga nivalis TaxID=2991709 RepID=A0ABT3IPA8_9BACT|nr:S8 family serine peptidase [Chitinophaga nivalis]MCW3464501.1 S8 family serine peptidase [Chitinophaga nivalis]MCW3485808.1 S8 family serine peptidase [Chitinophaga nivalis]
MTIGVIDTGVDLNNAIIGQADIDGIVLFKNEDGSIVRKDGFSQDERGHGTPIISTILSHSLLAKLFVVKVTSFNGSISEDLLEAAIAYLMQHTDAVIINISMGIRTEQVSETLLEICQQAYEQGVTIVAAAHSMINQPCYPAHSPYVLGVGEANTTEKEHFYYLENAPTNLFTKGDFKHLAFPNQQFDDCKGTSFATANLTGLIAAAYLNKAWHNPQTLKAWLISHAVNHKATRAATDNLDALLRQCKQLAQDDSATISKQYFNEQYGFPSIPVLFTQAFQDWQTTYPCTLPHLAHLLPHQEPVGSCDDAVKGIALTLKNYLQQDTAGLLYYKTNQPLSHILGEGFQTPAIFNCWYKNTASGKPSKNLSWMYVGTQGTYTGLHTDIWNTDAWNYLFSGRKLWLVYPKIYNEYIRKNIDRFRAGNLPDFMHHMLAEDCKPLVCIQEPGQMMYIPGHYHHAVINLDLTISVTENFINEINYDYVRSHFRSGANKKNMIAIESMIKEGFSNLENTSK